MVTEAVYVIETETDDVAIARMENWDDDYKDNEFLTKLVKYDADGNQIVVKSYIKEEHNPD
jgi:hypothetical protein